MLPFRSGRHLAEWLGQVPRQHSTGGKAKPGRITNMGDQYFRKLLIAGSGMIATTCRTRTAMRRSAAIRFAGRCSFHPPHAIVSITLQQLRRLLASMRDTMPNSRGTHPQCRRYNDRLISSMA
jgi:Transposase IS116/IS110/IS902 family